MRRTTIAGVFMMGLALAACQTITEEMPGTGNNPNGPSQSPVPVVVIPVPIPTPPPATPPPAPPPPDPAPGGGGGNTPPPTGGGDIPNNTNPVAKLTAKVYFVECYGQIVPEPAPVGCRIHMDVTPTDASNHHTQAQGTPRWTYTNMGIISVSGNSPYNPVLDAKAEGDLDAWAEVDGIRSNTVHIAIR